MIVDGPVQVDVDKESDRMIIRKVETYSLTLNHIHFITQTSREN